MKLVRLPNGDFVNPEQVSLIVITEGESAGRDFYDPKPIWTRVICAFGCYSDIKGHGDIRQQVAMSLATSVARPT